MVMTIVVAVFLLVILLYQGYTYVVFTHCMGPMQPDTGHPPTDTGNPPKGGTAIPTA